MQEQWRILISSKPVINPAQVLEKCSDEGDTTLLSALPSDKSQEACQ